MSTRSINGVVYNGGKCVQFGKIAG